MHLPLLGGREDVDDGGNGDGVPRLGGVGEATPPDTCCLGWNGLPGRGSTLTTWGPCGCVTPGETGIPSFDGLGSWPEERSLDIMATSLERPAGPLGGPCAPAAGETVGEAAVVLVLSDDEPVRGGL